MKFMINFELFDSREDQLLCCFLLLIYAVLYELISQSRGVPSDNVLNLSILFEQTKYSLKLVYCQIKTKDTSVAAKTE
jgi:hypothetical protein